MSFDKTDVEVGEEGKKAEFGLRTDIYAKKVGDAVCFVAYD